MKDFIWSVVSLGLALLLWEAASVFISYFRGVSFPGPWPTLIRLADLIKGQLLVDYPISRHLLDSLVRWGIGFGAASLVGLVCGLALGWRRLFDKLLMQIVYFLQLIPGLAWLPVAILFFGIGESATYFIIGITAFAPIVINVAGGVKRVDEMYIRAARMLGAGTARIFFRVLLPGALPQIISGLRIGLGNSWRVLIAAEMIVGAGTGLGYSIMQSRWTLDYAGAFVCIIVICLVGLAVEKLFFVPLEKLTVDRWGLARE